MRIVSECVYKDVYTLSWHRFRNKKLLHYVYKCKTWIEFMKLWNTICVW